MSGYKNTLRSIGSLVRSSEFARASAIAVAVVLPLVISFQVDFLSYGISMAVGVFLSSPSDVPGSLRRRVIGILASISIAVLASFLAGSAAGNLIIFLPLLLLLVFVFSIITVYGFRASLVSFSGLLAVVLSMVTLTSGVSVLQHSLWIGIGGLWYLSFSLFLYYLNPYRQSEEFLEETFELTARYLRVRNQLLGAPEATRKELELKLANLQNDLNANHETVRELLISKRRASGRSSDARKKLLIFIELVDILELGMANPVNYTKMNALFSAKDEPLVRLKEWTELMASELDNIRRHLKDRKSFIADPRLKEFSDIILHQSLPQAYKDQEKYLILRGLYHFKEKQYQKILAIERLLLDMQGDEKIILRRKDAIKFIPTQEFAFKTLLDNLDKTSPIFRHSLRLSVIVLLGFWIGKLLGLQNAYWILLTSIVIMRPGYGLTKTRSRDRTIGTLIGGAIAAGIIYLVQDPVVFGILAFFTFIIAFSTLQKNYRTSAAFITLNIVFVYGLIAPNAFEVIEFRVLDTLIGAGLALLGNAFLWPSWEYRNIKMSIAQSLKANQKYLEEIHLFYEGKASVPATYKYSRKEAFLAMGNLNAAFQRMTQEPRSKQKDLKELYEIVSLLQEMLFSAASLGSFIRTHHTTRASVHFRNLISAIQTNLSNSVKILEELSISEDPDPEEMETAQSYFRNMLEELVKEREQELELDPGKKSMLPQRIQEAQLVMDQLRWLLEISENLKHKATLVRWPDK